MDEHWLINCSLKSSLLGFASCSDLHVVCLFDLQASTLSIEVVETIFSGFGGVWFSISTLMHYLNVLARSHACRSTLWSVSHYCHLSIGVHRLVEVSNSDSRSDWIIVTANSILILNIELLASVEWLRNHLKTVGIDPESLIRVKAIHKEPVNDNIFTGFVQVYWNFIGGNVELYKVFNLIKVDSNVGTDLLGILLTLEFVLWLLIFTFRIWCSVVLSGRWRGIFLFVDKEELGRAVSDLLLRSLKVYFTISEWLLSSWYTTVFGLEAEDATLNSFIQLHKSSGVSLL